MWLCGDDFNKVLNLEETLGGNDKTNCHIDDLREVVDDCSKDDLGHEGESFTWNNKWDEDLILECLDRCFGNMELLDRFQEIKVLHLDF